MKKQSVIGWTHPEAQFYRGMASGIYFNERVYENRGVVQNAFECQPVRVRLTVEPWPAHKPSRTTELRAATEARKAVSKRTPEQRRNVAGLAASCEKEAKG